MQQRRLGDQRFRFAGQDYPYCIDRYGFTWRTERAVEVPVARAFLDSVGSGSVLEIGNVMSHFGRQGQTVVDKYDRRAGVINEDIDGFVPGQKFDCLVSVSTLEHVGFDEEIRDPEKLPRVLRGLKHLVRDRGAVLVTLPLGYNPVVDDMVRRSDLPFSECGYLVRGPQRRWTEGTRDQALAAGYDHRRRAANAVLIGRGLLTS